jgi:hypothetical protein
MDRFQGHFYNINKKKLDDPIGKHFSSPNHTGEPTLTIQIVDFINSHPESNTAAMLRDEIEKNWIHRLRTTAPFGLNTMD